jgi:hypothetical protein
MSDQPTTMPNNQIAFVIDNVVQEVIFVGDRFNAILTSNPTIVSWPSNQSVQTGYNYTASGGFTIPSNMSIPNPPFPIVD